MGKQINSINGYSYVQVQVKVQFYDFSKRSACDVLTHAFYSPPTLKSCETLHTYIYRPGQSLYPAHAVCGVTKSKLQY